MAAELVAREPEELKVLGVLRLELLVDLLEAFELRGEAALGGSVDGEDDFAFQGREREGLALFCAGGSCVSEGDFFFLFSELATVRSLHHKNKKNGGGVYRCGRGDGVCVGVRTVGGLEIEKGGSRGHGSGLEEAWMLCARFGREDASEGAVVVMAR